MTTTKNRLPIELQPVGQICVPLFVPDDSEWLWLAAKCLSFPTAKRFWQDKDDGNTDTMIAEWQARVYLPFVDRISNGVLCEGSLVTCQDIVDCIETSPDVETAIKTLNDKTGFLNPDGIGDVTNNYINNRFPANKRSEPIKDLGVECDKDKLWTGILEIVKRLDENSRDAWQDLAALSDKADRIAEAIQIIPVLGSVSIEWLDFLAEVIPDLLTAYESHSSTEVLEDIACDLFDMVCADCRYPTYDELYEYYANLGITGIQDILSYGVDAAVDYLVGSSTLANSVVFFTTNAIQLYFRYLGTEWLGKRGTKWIAIWADIGEDNPNNGWELLCDACEPEWCYELPLSAFYLRDFSSQAGVQTAGVWNDPQWDTTTNALGTHQVTGMFLEYDISAIVGDLANMTRYEVNFTANRGTGVLGTDYAGNIIELNAAKSVIFQSLTHGATQPEFNVNSVWNLPRTIDPLTRYLVYDMSVDDVSNAGTPTGDGSLFSIKIYGTGTPPVFAGNC